MSPAQPAFAQVNPHIHVTDRSISCGTPVKLAKDKTEQLYLATFPSALPDVHKGVRILKPKAS